MTTLNYNFTILGRSITTVVTTSQDFVDDWIEETNSKIDEKVHPRILGLGLDIVDSKSQPVFNFHLSFASYCLIYRMKMSEYLPHSLEQFLFDMDNTFVGVRLESKLKRLRGRFEGDVSYIDLGLFAADVYDHPELLGAEISSLAKHVLNKDVVRPQVGAARWDATMLSDQQVEYATIGAYLALQIGLTLNARKPGRVSLLKAQQEEPIERVCYIEILDGYFRTVVTMQQIAVENWVDDIMHDGNVHRYVGFDVREIFVDNKPRFGTIQFCFDFHCLIIQFYQMKCRFLPNLERFLIHDNNTFVGFDIERKMRLLVTMLDIEVRGHLRGIDLGRFAAIELKEAGHEALAEPLLKTHVERPETQIDWGRRSRLSNAQVKSLCVDAVVSFQIANRLFPPRN